MDQTQIFELKNTVTEMNSVNGLTSRMGNRAIENAQSVQQTGKKKKITAPQGSVQLWQRFNTGVTRVP